MRSGSQGQRWYDERGSTRHSVPGGPGYIEVGVSPHSIVKELGRVARFSRQKKRTNSTLSYEWLVGLQKLWFEKERPKIGVAYNFTGTAEDKVSASRLYFSSSNLR